MTQSEQEKQATIFFILIAGIAIAVILITIFNLWSTTVILALVAGVLIAIYTQSHHFFAELQEYERAVVFEMGKFKKIAGPGWLFLIPFFQSYVRVDLRVKAYDIHPQEVITSDNIKLKLDAVIYAKVGDVKKAILHVKDYESSMKTYVGASLRSVIGKMLLTDVISEITQINAILQQALQQVTTDWGLDITKVEIQYVELPKDVQESMHELKAAEQKKLAQIERAQAKKLTIEAIQQGAGTLTKPALQYLYLESLQKIADGKSTKIIFPLELFELAQNLTSKFGSFAKAQDKVAGRYKEIIEENPQQPHRKTIQEIAEEFGVDLGQVLPERIAKREAEEHALKKRKRKR